jgi:hypothetical protein
LTDQTSALDLDVGLGLDLDLREVEGASIAKKIDWEKRKIWMWNIVQFSWSLARCCHRIQVGY